MRLSALIIALALNFHAVFARLDFVHEGNGLTLDEQEEKLITHSLKNIYTEERNPWFERSRLNKQSMLRCSDKLLCSEEDRPLWLARRAFVKAILEVMKKRGITTGYSYSFGDDGRVKFFVNATIPEMWVYKSSFGYTLSFTQDIEFRKNYSGVRKLLSKEAARMHENLCVDNKYAGFLLDEESDHWPIGCSWKGSEGVGNCIPVPNSTTVISYVKSDQWVKKLAKFRSAIGCALDETAVLGNIPELYQCRMRCTDSGIGMIQMLILMGSVYAILALACTQEHNAAQANN